MGVHPNMTEMYTVQMQNDKF